MNIFPRTVCPHYGVLTVGLGVVSFATAAFNCAGSHRVSFATTVQHGMVAAEFWIVLPGFRALFEQRVVFTWRVQEIGWFWRVETWFYVAGAKNRTHREKCGRHSTLWMLPERARTLSFEGLRFTWQAQGIRTMDAMFWGRRARFLRRVAFLELELGDQFAWPVQHFVWPRVMISWQVQSFWNMFPFSWKSRRKCSLWKSGSSVFEEVSHKTLLLKSGSSVFQEVSQNLFVYKILMQVVQEDLNTEILRQRWSYRILIEVVLQDPDTVVKRSCYRDLAQVRQDPDTRGGPNE